MVVVVRAFPRTAREPTAAAADGGGVVCVLACTLPHVHVHACTLHAHARCRGGGVLSLTHPLTACSPQVAEAYKCSPVEGVLSHQMKKHVIDANK
eukprot:scaffold82782_cov58-Phaeocystis_antarctica.AAC.1